MPLKITLENNIQNNSLQIGDEAYYVELTNGFGSDPNALGPVTEIGHNYIVIDTVVSTVDDGDFIMFSKNNKANLTSILGYYANITMINHSKEKIELFSVASEISQSSK